MGTLKEEIQRLQAEIAPYTYDMDEIPWQEFEAKEKAGEYKKFETDIAKLYDLEKLGEEGRWVTYDLHRDEVHISTSDSPSEFDIHYLESFDDTGWCGDEERNLAFYEFMKDANEAKGYTTANGFAQSETTWGLKYSYSPQLAYENMKEMK